MGSPRLTRDFRPRDVCHEIWSYRYWWRYTECDSGPVQFEAFEKFAICISMQIARDIHEK